MSCARCEGRLRKTRRPCASIPTRAPGAPSNPGRNETSRPKILPRAGVPIGRFARPSWGACGECRAERVPFRRKAAYPVCSFPRSSRRRSPGPCPASSPRRPARASPSFTTPSRSSSRNSRPARMSPASPRTSGSSCSSTAWRPCPRRPARACWSTGAGSAPRGIPRLSPFPLASTRRRPMPVRRTPRKPPVLLCVGSIEGRKNHAALLEACETLWSRGLGFELRLVGISNPETGGPALEKLERLRASGRPLRHDGPVDDATLEAAYRECSFTVYPSLAEGFGLPVAESLARGRPCLCRTDGALGEIARGGGCIGLGAAGPSEIAAGDRRAAGKPLQLASLSAEAARGRKFKAWSALCIGAFGLDGIASAPRIRRSECVDRRGPRVPPFAFANAPCALSVGPAWRSPFS